MLFLAFWCTVHPYGSRTSPGSIGAVPEVLFSEIEKVQVIPQTPNSHSCRGKLPPNEEDLSFTLYTAPVQCFHSRYGVNGSIWQQAYWGGQPVVTRQFSPTKASVTADLVLLEMDTLR